MMSKKRKDDGNGVDGEENCIGGAVKRMKAIITRCGYWVVGTNQSNTVIFFSSVDHCTGP